ncbi:MAG: hypothetical protein ACOCXM_07690 [Myxococcota bacterium]
MAQRPLGYAVNARVDSEAGVVEGALHASVEVPAGARAVRLWLYGDRLAVAPAALDEINARWIFPGERDRGGVSITEVRVDDVPVKPRLDRYPPGTPRGRDVAGSDLWVPVPDGAGRVGIRLRFTLRLPRRFGRLGRVGDRLTMAAPWYPLVVGEDDTWDFEVPHRVRVELAGGGQGLLGSQRFERRTEVRSAGPYVPLVVAPELHVRSQQVNGIEVRYIAPEAPYAHPDPSARGLDALHDVVRIDVVDQLGEQLEHVLATLRMMDLPVPADVVTVVEVPSRTELAATAPGWTLLSDRAYQVFPLDAVRDFHHRTVRHALFRHQLSSGPRPEVARDRPWATDLRAALLVDLDLARRENEALTPRELLGWAGFHPLVDQLLYAPQVAFEDVYFGDMSNGTAFRDAPMVARRPTSTGRRILEMARDALGSETTADFARGLLSLQVPAPALLADVAPEHADRLPVWLGAPGLPVNYRLGEIDSEKVPQGFRHRIEIIREGAPRPEPVEVEVEDEGGHREVSRWDGEGMRGVVEVTTPEPLDDVTLDPRHRLVQSAELAQGHPRGDDALRHPWRPPILRGIYLSASVSDRRLQGFVDFVMRRRYELDHGIGVRLESEPRSSSGLFRYIRKFGPRRHTNDRMAFVSAGIQGLRLHEEFTEEGQGGWRTDAIVSMGLDTHRYFIDPREGYYVTGSGRVGVVRQDDGDVEPTWSLSGRANGTWPLGLRTVVMLIGGAAYTGGAVLPGELPGLGGQQVLRGYEVDELVGRGRLFGVIEQRWTALSDLALNALHLAWVREIQLAWFAGAGAVFRPLDGRDVGGGVELGAGVRFHFEYAGVQPGVLAVDVGVPLVRQPQARRNRPPYTLRVTFDQYY